MDPHTGPDGITRHQRFRHDVVVPALGVLPDTDPDGEFPVVEPLAHGPGCAAHALGDLAHPETFSPSRREGEGRDFRLAEVDMESSLSPATANLTLAALRGVARAAWRLGLMSAEDLARIRDVPRVGGSRLPAGRSATGGELAALLAACGRDPGPLGARDGALLAVLYGGGLRRAEISALAIDAWDAERRVRRVRGKGDKERLVPLPPGAAAALADWLAVRGRAPGLLFHRILKGGRVVATGITTQAVYDILLGRATLTGVDDLSPHDLRRTYAGDLLDAGADLSVTQQLLGHASPVTTARYDRRGEGAKRRAAALLHVPYARRRG